MSTAYEKISKFWGTNSIPQEVTKTLKEGAVAEVQLEGDSETYMMIKENGKSHFRKGKPQKPQIYFKYSEGALDYMLEVKGADQEAIEEYVARFSECILNPTKERYVEFKLCTNVLTLARMGYFGMLFAGGARAVTLAKIFSKKMGLKIPERFFKQDK